jgi:dihydrofolate synthase/folylpolyglutamate synthase
VSTSIRTYQDACRYLDDLQMHKIKLGLEAMGSTLAALGSPEKKCPAVHVAGTNGKGSVCSMLSSVMTAAGHKAGLYTSPHLSSVRERFRIGDRYISEETFTRLMELIRVSLGGSRITYFECTTALAFLWFAENDCDLVILETGMGGRLDATNVILPLLSVITTISLDHEQYLGSSIQEVAYEKGGIIKEHVPLISGVDNDEAQQVIARICRERHAPMIIKDRDFALSQEEDRGWVWRSRSDELVLVSLPLLQPNRWQRDNICCAVAAAVQLRQAGFQLESAAIDRGIGSAHWPGRMELIETPLRFLLDGAHNQAGVDFLLESLPHYGYDRLFVVWASMADKNFQKMLNDVAAVADSLLLTRPDSERSARPEDLYVELRTSGGKDIRVCDSVEAALAQVQKQANPEDLILVAGSLYLIGAFRELLVGKVIQ